MAQKVEVRISAERVEKVLTVDEFIALQEQRSMRTIKTVISKFIVDENGNYLDDKIGAEFVGKMTIEQLKDIMTAFQSSIEELAPKVSSATSD